ncbi:DUF2160 domain-containing protein [Pseudogemmobacter faecipullorum]|nr:DUF2160 domain-containing protein [Pseudogemmobacter faecipullorum]
MTQKNFILSGAGFAALMLALLALLWSMVPQKDGAANIYGQLSDGNWMAWTFPVALFFWCIAALLITMTLLALRFPETPRRGLLRIETTRGDRLFISLLGSAFIALIWLFFAGPPVWGALILCLIWAAVVFAWV